MSTVKAEELGNAELHSTVVIPSIPEAARDKARLDRKRTKTGCLTCRRRRIKCDEGKPICRNCQKSRRQCEGYNQRVVYKPADFQYLGPHGAATITFHSSTLPGEDRVTFQEGQTSFGQPELRPRAIAPHGHALHSGSQQYRQYVPFQDHLDQSQMYVVPSTQLHHLPQMPQQSWQPQQWDPNAHLQAPALMMMNVSYTQPPLALTQPGMTHSQALPHHLVYPVSTYNNVGQLPVNTTHQEHSAELGKTFPGWPPSASSFQTRPPIPGWGEPQSQPDFGSVQPDPEWQTGSTRVTISQTKTITTVQHEWPAPSHASKSENIPSGDNEEPTNVVQSGQLPPRFLAKQLYEHPENPDPIPSLPVARTPSASREDSTSHQSASPSRLLEDAAVELQDDDYYDIDQDDDMNLEVSAQILEQKSQGLLKKVVATSRLDMSVLDVQGCDTFIYEGILDTYRPEQAANPLRNSATARVFAHFITATGPVLTIFVRQTRVSSNLHNEGPLPLNQQGLWTYIMPMAALHHQGLLQAILAISSLHIAKLQHVSETPSWKHYGYALKWIHRAVRNPRKRQSTAILAATLLLGYYEILAANHTNWNTHLAGAKQLVVETDFASATKNFRRMKAEKATRDRQNSYYADMPPLVYNSHPQDNLLDQVPDIDETVVGILAGRRLNYDEHGQVFDQQRNTQTGSSLPLDIVDYETLKDLFWWYCKQDVYQSIISGNALLMEFDRWTDCPPRAPLNKSDAVYGSFDHLMIVLARIADFSVRDRKRKLKVMQANGGAWRPTTGMQLGPPATQLRGERQQSTTSGPSFVSGNVSPPPSQSVPQDSTYRPPTQMPFFGMAPSRGGRMEMPASYKPRWQDRGHAQGASVPTASPPDNVSNLSAATELAVREWDDIKTAIDFFASQLGPSFQPLGPECKAPSQSPFGPAIFYRSLDISCLWALYNMCLLILARAHPHMPPAAHMAAGVASYQTRDVVMRIGRIAAGVVMPPLDQALHPNLAGAACDLSVPLFFAGIQYQCPDQRAWLIDRLFDVDRRAGWATAGIIAEGCQTAWVKAAEAGRGPPHDRVHKANFADNRVSKHRSSFQNIHGVVKDVKEEDDNDRKFVHTKLSTRLHWGIGIIGDEDDLGLDSHVG